MTISVAMTTREQIRKEMEGNLCRCTGYARIADAVLLAVEVEEEQLFLVQEITS